LPAKVASSQTIIDDALSPHALQVPPSLFGGRRHEHFPPYMILSSSSTATTVPGGFPSSEAYVVTPGPRRLPTTPGGSSFAKPQEKARIMTKADLSEEKEGAILSGRIGAYGGADMDCDSDSNRVSVQLSEDLSRTEDMVNALREELNKPVRTVLDANKIAQRYDDAMDQSMYTIVLDRSRGQKLGINLSSPDGEEIVINSISGEGLVETWNSRNPQMQVEPGDRIIDVNGTAVVAQTLLRCCESSQVLTMTLTRPNIYVSSSNDAIYQDKDVVVHEKGAVRTDGALATSEEGDEPMFRSAQTTLATSQLVSAQTNESAPNAIVSSGVGVSLRKPEEKQKSKTEGKKKSLKYQHVQSRTDCGLRRADKS
jgi:hypothetical protein